MIAGPPVGFGFFGAEFTSFVPGGVSAFVIVIVVIYSAETLDCK